jgi:menaquinone-dependent protoporphyrinogen oxidase
MTRILILFGTTDGQTAKVARFIGDELGALGANVDVFDAATANPDPRVYDGVVVAASVHGGKYQRAVVRWVRTHAVTLCGLPSAFVSVCLAVLQTDVAVIRELDAIVHRFEAATGWEPERVKLVPGALLYTRYGWLKRLIMRRISRKAGGDTDTSRDHEYTDWKDLRSFAATFWALHVPAPLAACDVRPGSACRCEHATIPD